MLFIAFSRSALGILFVMRTLHVFRERALVPPPKIDAIGLIALILISLIGFFDAGASVVGTIGVSVATLAPLALAIAGERRRITAFAARVPLFLDHWILNMRLGASVNAARAAALRAESAPVQALLAPVFEGAPGDRRRHLILSPPVLRELEMVSRTSHAALERLETVRAHVRESAEFRRKSGQAVRQSAIQSAVMLIMLVALSIFTVHRYGWSFSGDFVTAAAALSTLGTVLMARLARKGRWIL